MNHIFYLGKAKMLGVTMFAVKKRLSFCFFPTLTSLPLYGQAALASQVSFLFALWFLSSLVFWIIQTNTSNFQFRKTKKFHTVFVFSTALC